jgi:hypothetical protein
MAGHSERRMLVEGWAYVAPESVGLPSNERTNRSSGPPFWDPERLRRNDEAFENPTEENLADLRRRYGVDWLLVDTRREADVDALAKLADERFRMNQFVVFALDDAAD